MASPPTTVEKKPTPQELLWEKTLQRLEDMDKEALEPLDGPARRKELLVDILHSEMLAWRYLPVETLTSR